jgi:hypothetical protein
MKMYRTGNCWGVTIVESEESETANDRGRRKSDRLIATAQTQEDANLIVRALAHWRKFEETS